MKRPLRNLVLISVIVALSGCLADTEVPRLADVDLPDDAENAGLASAEQGPVLRDGVFAELVGRGLPDEERGESKSAIDAAVVEALEADGDDVVSETPASPRRSGLFGVLRTLAPSAPAETEGRPVVVAALDAAPDAEADIEKKPRRNARRAKSTEPDVAAGAPLAFGEVGRVCGLRGRALGKKVESFPDRGRGYTLFDSAPGSTSARAFFITGFADGCARQVTAANAIFGAPSMHERLRYGLPAGTLPSSRTDEAYKTLKSKICRVPRAKPCGDAVGKLERNTVFVSLYSSFTGNQQWSNLLLHDGALYASDIKQAQ